MFANDRDSYKYLIESIKKFPKQEEFNNMISDTGFIKSRYKNLSAGVASIHSAWKIWEDEDELPIAFIPTTKALFLIYGLWVTRKFFTTE